VLPLLFNQDKKPNFSVPRGAFFISGLCWCALKNGDGPLGIIHSAIRRHAALSIRAAGVSTTINSNQQQPTTIDNNREVNVAKFWCGVVSREHGKLSEAGGFCQIGSGRRAPLVRMAVGDGIVLYSPAMAYGGAEKCQRFTAIGTVTGDHAYVVKVTADFAPHRRDVRYRASQEAEIRPLLDRLAITAGYTNWGFKFRLGHYEMSAADFALIEQAMQAGLDEASRTSPAAASSSARRPEPGLPA
jgi:hypothetical protein